MTMFNSKENGRKEYIAGAPDTSTMIAKGTLLEGNVETFGNIRIEGKIVGNIKTKSKISQGDGSVIDGNIISQTAEIAGEVKGKVEVLDLLILKTTAIIHGDIVTNKLVVESGATFNGNCKMGAVINEIKLNDSVERRTEEQTA